MKTRKITVFAIASILGAIALTSCGSIVESSKNVGKAQPATEAVQTTEAAKTEATKPAADQSVKAESLSNTESAPVAQSVSYDANSNTVSYTQQPVTQAPAVQSVQNSTPVQQAAPVQNTTPSYQAANSTEQAAANNAIAYAGGNGYKIISSEAVQTSDGSAAYRFGIVPVDNAKAPAWYYIAGANFAMTEGEWINKKDKLDEGEWERYYDSAEHRFAAASQQAGLNAIAASGLADGMIVSCDFVNYDYDKLQYAFKVGVRSMNDSNAKIQYFMAGTDYAVKCEG